MRPKILLVEDEYALQASFTAYLEPAYAVTATNTAQGALEHMKAYHFKVMLVDLGLPDTSGLNVIRQVIKENPKTVILALTGDRSSESVQSAIEAGVDDYIVKPVTAAQLHNRIEKAILKRTIAGKL